MFNHYSGDVLKIHREFICDNFFTSYDYDYDYEIDLFGHIIKKHNKVHKQ